jgi:hypothetical protein
MQYFQFVRDHVVLLVRFLLSLLWLEENCSCLGRDANVSNKYIVSVFKLEHISRNRNFQ